jgi:hypothetical protein
LLSDLARQQKLYDFLHEKGYNAFTIPRLVPAEIIFLVEGHNKNMRERAKKSERAYKKQQRRRR